MKKYPAAVTVLTLLLFFSVSSCKKNDTAIVQVNISYSGGYFLNQAVTGHPVTFHADKNISGYLWDFGDGEKSNDAVPVHSYSQPGSYHVSLQVNGSTSNIARLNIAVVKDPIYTSQIGGLRLWGRYKHNVQNGLDSAYSDTTFAISYVDPLTILIGRSVLVYDEHQSSDSVLVFGASVIGATHNLPDTSMSVSFFRVKDSIIYSVFPSYSGQPAGVVTNFHTK